MCNIQAKPTTLNNYFFFPVAILKWIPLNSHSYITMIFKCLSWGKMYIILLNRYSVTEFQRNHRAISKKLPQIPLKDGQNSELDPRRFVDLWSPGSHFRACLFFDSVGEITHLITKSQLTAHLSSIWRTY